MLLNYVKLSLRLMARSPFFTLINVGGLSLGFAVFFILWPYSQSELRGDEFIKDHEEIVRPLYNWQWIDMTSGHQGQVLFPLLHSYLLSEMKGNAQIRDATRLLPQSNFDEENTPGLEPVLVFSTDQDPDSPVEAGASDAICGDQNFLEFFDLPVLEGNRKTALDIAESAVLTESLAKKFFPGSALGQHLVVNGRRFLVTAVIKDLPASSHLQFQILFSNVSRLSYWNDSNLKDWNLCYQYFKMDRPDELAALLELNKEKILGGLLARNPHVRIDFQSQLLEDIVFTQSTFETFKTKSRLVLRSLLVVSIVILIMAWMNYINLSVSRVRVRFKEMATRKAVGALLPDLLLQFTCQSIIMNAFAVLIGITLIQIASAPFEYFLDIRILPLSQLDVKTLGLFILVFVVGVLATACYPAWITLRHTTHQMLIRKVATQKKTLTTLFTTAQYIAAVTLIVWIFVMHSQLTFILNMDLGINKESVAVIEAPRLGHDEHGDSKMAAFAEHVRRRLARQVTLSGRVCGEDPLGFNVRRRGENGFTSLDSHGGVDDFFIPFFGIKLIAGRNFQKEEKGLNVILSRFATERLGFQNPEDAVGQLIEIGVGAAWNPVEVIGVVEDFRATSYHDSDGNSQAVTGKGIVLTHGNTMRDSYMPERVSLRIGADEVVPVISQVEAAYKEAFPGKSFNWFYLDDRIARQYGDQQSARNQLTFFSALAIVVACLGLLGMVSNHMVEKTREIGVRRILGAELRHVATLLLNSTLVQISVAIAVGLPAAWKFSTEYLQHYTHKIDMAWWHFALPVVILIGIMLMTVVSVLWKAMHINVSEVLKSEY